LAESVLASEILCETFLFRQPSAKPLLIVLPILGLLSPPVAACLISNHIDNTQYFFYQAPTWGCFAL